ncbi:MAG: cyclase family protein [Clostridia bacterium]|nr:cyclase family protein [Clostridia bacterium]
MRIYDISQEILSSKVYPGDPTPEKTQLLSISEGAACNLSKISMCLHNGTHIDAPCHFVEGAQSIDQMELETFIGECRVVFIPEEIITGEMIDNLVPDDTYRLLIKTTVNGALTQSAATALLDKGVKLVGIDNQTVGIDGQQAPVHLILLHNDIVILEGLNLAQVPEGDYILSAFPLSVQGADGAPCRAVLLQD